MAETERLRVEIRLPRSQDTTQAQDILDTNGVLVVVGANGAGKTRFGVWLENSGGDRAHRVSAQKSLEFPENLTLSNLEQAGIRLRGGDLYGGVSERRAGNRWGNRPETFLLNDYQILTQYLFSEEQDQSTKYRKMMQGVSEYRQPPETQLDVIKRIWESVLPRQELKVGSLKIEASRRGAQNFYNAGHLSDGERVIFYLIGQALATPPDGTLIVDEPELHLHRAIQAPLWDLIEAERPDCTFIYLTHDLDFAASRRGATKIWLREYENGEWNWKVIPENEELPEPMFLELLGSRKPILFVEGDKGSLDYFLYGKIYPARTVVPCGPCDHVIHATASFRAITSLHSNECQGLVDFDGGTTDEITHLQQNGVEVVPVGHVENLFLLEPVVVQLARVLALDEQATLAAVKAKVFQLLSNHRELVVSQLTARELEGIFRRFDATARGKIALQTAFQNAYSGVDPKAVYERWDDAIGRVITDQVYHDALKYYRNKGLVYEVGFIFQTNVRDFVLRKIRTNEGADILAAMRSALPQIT